jgi:hypothetical protein
MVQKQFARRQTADKHTFGHDRDRIDLKVFTNDDEGCVHKAIVGCQWSVVSCFRLRNSIGTSDTATDNRRLTTDSPFNAR